MKKVRLLINNLNNRKPNFTSPGRHQHRWQRTWALVRSWLLQTHWDQEKTLV